MADYTPTFDPTLSGLSPAYLLNEAVYCARLARTALAANRRAFARRADLFEHEFEERWLVHAAEVRVHIGPNGSVVALGAQAAFRSFVGAGR